MGWCDGISLCLFRLVKIPVKDTHNSERFNELTLICPAGLDILWICLPNVYLSIPAMGPGSKTATDDIGT